MRIPHANTANGKKILTLFLAFVVFALGIASFPPSAHAGTWCYPDQGEPFYIEGTECPPGIATGPEVFGQPDASGGAITTFKGLINHISAILNTVIPFLLGLGVFVIIFGIFKYISHAAEEEKRSEAKLFIIWGVVGLFMMLSIWGFLNILVNTFPLRRSPVPVGSIFPTSKP